MTRPPTPVCMAKHVLVVRYAALGDLSMLWAVLDACLADSPSLRFTLMTRKEISKHLPQRDRLTVIGLDLDTTYQRPGSLMAFYYGWLRSHQPDQVVDMHQHLRTASLRWLTRLLRYPLHTLAKDRKGRRQLLKDKRSQVAPMQSQYAKVLHQAGLFVQWPPKRQPLPRRSAGQAIGRLILAPFASKASKAWDADHAMALASLWADAGGTVTFLGSPNELQSLPDSSNAAINTVPPSDESSLWSEASVAMVCDSANQHLAAIHRLPMVSLWMGTSPLAGFLPFSHGKRMSLSLPEPLPCQPCSIFGTETCHVGGFPCRQLSASVVFRALQAVLH